MSDPPDMPATKVCAACAAGENDSGGRRWSEPEHPYRGGYQRDRDRVIHCAAFRRLDYKTQVFVPHQQDHFRTRLTHTIEVAQIARDLARALGLNEDLCEAVALAHDLGHPPFGHAGEKVLDELMTEHGHFEHNRQSLRVVDYLEHPYPDFRGLNLCRITRECLAKHTTRYDSPVCEDFDPALAAPLEGQLVDLCDEIAYTSADVDDALQAWWIAAADLEDFALWRRAFEAARRRWPDARPIPLQIRAAKNILAILADDALATTAARVAGAGAASLNEVRRAGKLAGFSDETAAQLREIQDFMFRRVYTHPLSEDKSRQGRRIITALFELFTGRPEKSLPPRYLRRVESDGLQRVACDFIAGMTDRFCLQQYDELIANKRK